MEIDPISKRRKVRVSLGFFLRNIDLRLFKVYDLSSTYGVKNVMNKTVNILTDFIKHNADPEVIIISSF